MSAFVRVGGGGGGGGGEGRMGERIIREQELCRRSSYFFNVVSPFPTSV